jgi:hypothetical protein
MNEKEKLMTLLSITEKEAEELMAYDRKVNKGEKTEYDLSAEKQKVANDLTKAHTRTVYNFTKPKEHKTNEVKASLITFLVEALSTEVKNLVVLNPERQLAFSVGEHQYELTLTQKRAKK